MCRPAPPPGMVQTLPPGETDEHAAVASPVAARGDETREDRAAMATVDECHDALEQLAERLSSVDEEARRKHAFDRTLSCHIPDLDLTFTGALRDGHLQDISTDPAPKAQIRLTAKSDDLVAMTDG